MKFYRKRPSTFKEWFNKPATAQDRIESALFGAWAGLWIGGLGRIIYETPVSFHIIVYFSFGGAILCLIAGFIMPKYSRVLFFPFAFLGIWSN